MATGANSYIHSCITSLSPSFSLSLTHKQTHAVETRQPHRFQFLGYKNKLPHVPLLSPVVLRGPVAGPGHTQLLCHCGAEEGSDLEELWRRSRGRAAGAPGARNVNWEDCFNKALISADAGRGLAGGATQTGGQLTVRYCQQT